MNTSNIKRYAPKARADFIAAVTRQAARYGITAEGIAPMVQKGDLVLIGERPFSKSITRARNALQQQVEAQGFDATMDKAAYSWFNRLCAIRFMELKGYLDHGRRVLSHPSDPQGFQILDDCLDIELPGLDRETVIELKLDGTKDEELYRELLLAQCHALHTAMPFLFEALDDATELLLPENLTKTDSLIRDLVAEVPEEDWQDIEIIGWLYQFYISEKKDQVIGTVVKPQDIPAATQLFTPNWIVKYMVQNSLGAQWLATYPDSPLKAQMQYYIEPPEQTDEVNAQLEAITPESLNPEELTLIDPASGSGHILVEAYELFKTIYLERGYRQRDVPQLILEKNLFGLDIDERAAQLTGFALMMKGRADDRRLFERGVKLNVMALVDSGSFDEEDVINGVNLDDYDLKASDITDLKRLFEHATTFGSLIQVPEELACKLPALKQLSESTRQDLFVSEALKRLVPLVRQAELLAAQYDAVVANPPYMGAKFYSPELKSFVNRSYAAGKADLYGCFIQRTASLCVSNGHLALITIPNWMFLSGFEELRQSLLDDFVIETFSHNGRGLWGSDFGSCSFTLRNTQLQMYRGVYKKLFAKQGSVSSSKELESNFHSCRSFLASGEEFQAIPGAPIAYWVSNSLRKAFADNSPLIDRVRPLVGLQTSDNARFVRLWHEVAESRTCFTAEDKNIAVQSRSHWFPLNKGGGFRKWYGLNEHVINWFDDGAELKQSISQRLGTTSYTKEIRSEAMYFRENLTWGLISVATPSFRYTKAGSIFNISGPSIFPRENLHFLAGLLNSVVVRQFLEVLSPSVSFTPGMMGKIPAVESVADREGVIEGVKLAIFLAEADWNSFEASWEFETLPLLTASTDPAPTLESCYTAWITANRDTNAEMQRIEEENNRLFIDAYGLADELTPDVPIEQITLTVNPAYRYGSKLDEAEQWARFRQDTMEELVSYAIGCMMGRYSLDVPGLIYAHSGNEGFDPSQYSTFSADDDGIVPLTDIEWFSDDACNRVIEFIGKAWDASQLEQNLDFLAENLSPKKNESSRDTIRRYMSNKFFKDHLQTYKKRPIYWLFSSGKQKAFECLVYLHRYNEGTLARMRTEYVIPLTAKMATYVQKLEQDKEASGSAAETKRLEKEIFTLHKQQVELAKFDEKLRHYADQRIMLDLDDGVKVNYGRFGDLLAEVKTITGKNPEVA